MIRKQKDYDELERILKEVVVAYPRYYPLIFPNVLRKTTKNLDQDNRCLD
jgi:hypothetical protein